MVITPARFEDEMRRIYDGNEINATEAHDKADDLMIETLNSLGYEAGTKIFQNAWK